MASFIQYHIIAIHLNTEGLQVSTLQRSQIYYALGLYSWLIACIVGLQTNRQLFYRIGS
jgi:hypothetical protein